MILDTTLIIDLMENIPEAIGKVKQLQLRQEHLFVSSITIFELWAGIWQSGKTEKEKRKVLDILESQLILDFSKADAEEAGKIQGLLVKSGNRIDPEDCMIAGTAKQHNEQVLTRNIKHFSRIKDLSVETY